MKITITPETDQEKEQLSEDIVLTEVVDFVVVGRQSMLTGGMRDICHLHTMPDKTDLIGRLFAGIEKLRNA